MKNIKALVLFTMVLATQISFADDNSVSSRYLKAIARDTQFLQEFNTNFKANFKKNCPSYRGTDGVGCIKNYISTLTVKSSTEAVLLSTVALGVVLQDVKDGRLNKEEGKLVITDTILSIYERIDTSKLYLSEMPTISDAEKVEIKMLRAEEQGFLKMGVKKLNDICMKSLNEVANSRNISSYGVSVAGKVEELKKRFEVLSSRQWVL